MPYVRWFDGAQVSYVAQLFAGGPADAVALIEDGARFSDFLVDYGDADQFLSEQLRPELLERACAHAEIPLNLRRQAGYDHSYYFVSTFMEDHLRWHAARLAA